MSPAFLYYRLFLFPALIVSFYRTLPSLIESHLGSYTAYSTAYCFVKHFRTTAVSMIVNCILSSDTDRACGLGSIDISSEENELPALFLLHFFDEFLHVLVAVLSAGVLHTVSCNNKQRFFGNVLFTGILMDICDVVNSVTRFIYALPDDATAADLKNVKARDVWYVGGINDDNAREVSFKLDFLKPGVKYEATIYADAKDASGIPDEHYNAQAYTITKKTVTNKSTLKLRMAPCGGFAVSLRSL